MEGQYVANEANTIAVWETPEGLIHQMLYMFGIETPSQVNDKNAIPTASSSLPPAALQIAHTRGRYYRKLWIRRSAS